MIAERSRKVALIGVDAGPGESGSVRWTCFAWDAPQSSANLHDYDAWVLFMPSLPEQMKTDGLYNMLSIDYVWEALMSGTRVVVVGDPRVSAYVVGRAPHPFLHWTGYDFQWKSTGGDTIDVANDSYKYAIENYLRRIKGWDYALRGMTRSDWFEGIRLVRTAKANRERLGLILISLAQNRNSELISGALQLCLFAQDDRLEREYESIVMVPFGRLEPTEALSAVLAEAFGISIRQQAPTWAEQLVAPGQAPLDAAISEIRGEISAREVALQLKLQERTGVRSCLDVLFQIGTPLEDAVERLLGELGAIVERPGTTVDCDRYLSIEIAGLTRRAALEIKGTSKPQFDMRGFKQVLQWRDEAMIARGEEHRAVFIGNGDAEAPPESRASPFGDGWRRQTKLHKVTALTTQTLYQAYCAKAEGQLKIEEFWESLFSTDGIFELKDAVLRT